MRPWRGLKECVAEPAWLSPRGWHPALKVWPQRSGPGSIQQSSHVQVMLARQPRNAELEALTWTIYLNGVWRHCTWIWKDLFQTYLDSMKCLSFWKPPINVTFEGMVAFTWSVVKEVMGYGPDTRSQYITEVTSMNSSIQSKGTRSRGATPRKFSLPPISFKSSIYRCSHRPLLIFLSDRSDRSPQTYTTRASVQPFNTPEPLVKYS